MKMCTDCDARVATVAEHMDDLLAAERKRRDKDSDWTNAEHTVALANLLIDAFNDADDQHDSLREMALGFSCAMTRLIAVQEIHGVSFT